MCDEGVKWIYDVFGDCLVTERDKWSFGLGMGSNVFFVICTVPQIYSNYKTKQVSGQSPALFSLIFLGTLLGCIGIVVTNGLPTQIVSAFIYVAIDSVTLVQYWYYRCKNSRQKDDDIQLGIGEGIEMGQGPGIGMGMAALVQTGAAIDWKRPYQGKELAGTLFGWISSSVYISSRIPQLIANIKNKKVSDLAPGYFLLQIVGNIMYTSSVFIRSLDGDFLWMEAPFIVGSVGPMTCDIITLMQMAVYGNGEGLETTALLIPNKE